MTILPALLAEENSALIDNALDLMVVLDATGHILRANAAALPLLGYAPDELVGRHYNEVVHPEQREEALGIQGSLQNEYPERPDIPLRMRRRDGRVVLMSMPRARPSRTSASS
ncbi:PAS domain-containing protein [Massilia yuzhufengensis]|uniref:PAS domain S-box-containing protein n=1 Tax=Massilia yuzhufengensis TaxID=1164594 RepID=A0A1I1UUQ9_9BURK|nr:PAS domain-containing protein [Massilia yuzhufengensis]SFD71760.1 PAS domain S-box-containing protein [Massilia yuzhufengensis]